MARKVFIYFIFILFFLFCLTPTRAQVNSQWAAGTEDPGLAYLPLIHGLPSLPQGTWEIRPQTMPTPRAEMAAVVIGDLVYVPGGVGGGEQLEVYDPAADSWRVEQHLPAGRHHLMAAEFAGKLHVFGGSPVDTWLPTSSHWVFDPDQGAWSSAAAMPEPRMSGVAVTLGDYIYIVGGQSNTDSNGRTLLRYFPAGNSWATLAPFSHAREHNAAVAANGKIYALGGRWPGLGETSSVEVYDPAANTWSFGPSMAVPRAGHGAALLDGRLYVAGGEVILNGNAALRSVEAYHLEAGLWQPAPDMPVALHGNPVVAFSGKLYSLGGSDLAGGAINFGRVLVYTPD